MHGQFDIVSHGFKSLSHRQHTHRPPTVSDCLMHIAHKNDDKTCLKSPNPIKMAGAIHAGVHQSASL